MREAHPVERAVGIEQYVTGAPGTGGRLRAAPEEFRVRELESFDVEPADADPGAYPHLVLRATLAGWDTNDFARALSDRLGISRERVSWAGTKDKHAVTTQLFSVRAPEFGPADVPAIDDATIEVVGRAGRALQFGDLAGNAFRIVVRDAAAPENAAAVTRELRGFAARGGVPAGVDADSSTGADADADGPVAVPNYFGQQRFGSRRAITHEVGLAIVRRGYREAVLAYAGNPSEHEPADSSEARRTVERAADRDPPDWEAALAALPARLGYERAMLQVLAERDAGRDDPDAYRAALEAVPSNLARLFVNAAQSYAFNRIVSERLRRGIPLGRPVAGDVVCFADELTTGATDDSAFDADAPAPATLAVPDPDRTQRVTPERVETVTRHCERGRAFVTAPLVGTETAFADGEPGEIEREVCERVGIEPGAFDLPEPFASRGTRRAVLVRTDADLTPGNDGDDGDDSYALGFALPKGSYATVVLREYLKSGPLDL